MEKIIQYFTEKTIIRFEKLILNFFKTPTNMAEFVYGLSDELRSLGLAVIEETLEELDQWLNDSTLRKENWVVEKHSAKQLITSLGTVNFQKTLFKNKDSGVMKYLIDHILGMEPHERMTEDAQAKMLEEAVRTSYERGGEACSLGDKVSKAAVKERLHTLNIPNEWEIPERKKKVEYLYIEADEDHLSLQFKEKKGDLVSNGNGQKNNTLISRLIYVHEGLEKESPGSKRYKLKNPHYFARVCEGSKENDAFWDEVYRYIQDTYDVDKIKAIYLSSDGGSWIRAGAGRIAGLIHVMDEFHLSKYITRLTSHMKDSTDDARQELYASIRNNSRKAFNETVDKVKACLTDDVGEARIEEARKYFLNNWKAARNRLIHLEGVVGCSAEGHVSFILSSRMSSRPMGWSTRGASKMTELRAYHQNGGDMLKLVRLQRKPLPAVSGEEAQIYSAYEVEAVERQSKHPYGKYYDTIQGSVDRSIAKKLYLNSHIWGL